MNINPFQPLRYRSIFFGIFPIRPAFIPNQRELVQVYRSTIKRIHFVDLQTEYQCSRATPIGLPRFQLVASRPLDRRDLLILYHLSFQYSGFLCKCATARISISSFRIWYITPKGNILVLHLRVFSESGYHASGNAMILSTVFLISA